ncbi:MAG: zinc-ribbon domain-containing protein, partial [Burkholderiales bacterium]
MSLITRCPTCGTAFRVQPAQLVARSGRVRCGKCSAVFDAISCLVGEEGTPIAAEPSPQLGLFDPSRRTAPAAADTTLVLDFSTAAPAASLPPPATTPPATPRPAAPPPAASSPGAQLPTRRTRPPPPAPPRIQREEPEEEVPDFLEDEAPVRH